MAAITATFVQNPTICIQDSQFASSAAVSPYVWFVQTKQDQTIALNVQSVDVLLILNM